MALQGGEKHGYAILREVNETPGGVVKLLPGTLYNLIKRMLEDRWIEELDERPDPQIDDERRRYYRLTGLGRQVVTWEAERLSSLVSLARQHGLLMGQENVPRIPNGYGFRPAHFAAWYADTRRHTGGFSSVN